MARQLLLDEDADFDWLFSTHLKAFAHLRERTKLALVFGNEDSPDSIALVDTDHYKAPAFATFTYGEDDTLKLDHPVPAITEHNITVRFVMLASSPGEADEALQQGLEELLLNDGVPMLSFTIQPDA